MIQLGKVGIRLAFILLMNPIVVFAQPAAEAGGGAIPTPSPPPAGAAVPKPDNLTTSQPAPLAPAATPAVPSDDTEKAKCLAPNPARPLRMLDKQWFLFGADALLGPWRDRTIGGYLEYVPWVSDKAVWFGIQAAASYDYRAVHEGRVALGPEIGYSWFSLFTGATYDLRSTSTPFGWRTKVALTIPIEIGGEGRELYRPECCVSRDCGCPLWRTEYRVMSCACDRPFWALTIRPYFELDYYPNASLQYPSTGESRRVWYPTFGLSIGAAHGWGG